jgi:mono/diheme cytochrome c family protein
LTALIRGISALALALMVIVPAGAPAQLADRFSEITEHMHEHLDQVNAMKVAVIAGNLEAVREPASWLADHEEPAWLPSVEEMQRYAARAAAAKDLVDAASALSEIARSCGECHEASGVAVAMGYSEPPSRDAQGLATQMQRHLWAADRMWAALVGPSDAAWKQGAEVLADVQLTVSDITAEDAQRAQILDLTQRAQAVGVLARQSTSVELRSGLLGEFLSLCATCHSLTGGGPGVN